MQAIITDNINSIKEICRNHHVKEMAVFGSKIILQIKVILMY